MCGPVLGVSREVSAPAKFQDILSTMSKTVRKLAEKSTCIVYVARAKLYWTYITLARLLDRISVEPRTSRLKKCQEPPLLLFSIVNRRGKLNAHNPSSITVIDKSLVLVFFFLYSIGVMN